MGMLQCKVWTSALALTECQLLVLDRQLKHSAGARNLFSGPAAVYDKMDPESVVYWSSKGNARG